MKRMGYLLWLSTIFFLTSCLSSKEDSNISLLEAEVKRLEADPETVGLELLDPVYDILSELYDMSRLWALQELTSDEVFAPKDGPDWDDSGVWSELNRHNWGKGHGLVVNTWGLLQEGQSIGCQPSSPAKYGLLI